jgi:hypothetical protein
MEPAATRFTDPFNVKLVQNRNFWARATDIGGAAST